MNMKTEMIMKLKNADAIIVSASNGFSISEGLNIFANDEKFKNLFGDFINKYSLQNILHGLFFNWPNEIDKWIFLSHLIKTYCLDYKESLLMKSLKEIIMDKPYFIVTSNGENHFELAGLNPRNILEIEGSWKYMRCTNPNHQQLYETFDLVKKMMQNVEKSDYEKLIPICPVCHSPMVINSFPKKEAQINFQEFIKEYHQKNIVILELGIGPRNQLIKAPLMEFVYQEPNAYYITINKGELYIPEKMKYKSIGFDGNLNDILPKIANQIK